MKKIVSLALGFCLILTHFSFAEKDKKDPFVIEVKPAKLSRLKKEAFEWLDKNMAELSRMNKNIWRFAEVAMEEYQSAELLAS